LQNVGARGGPAARDRHVTRALIHLDTSRVIRGVTGDLVQERGSEPAAGVGVTQPGRVAAGPGTERCER